ncbi:hypothetical protein [Limimaricola pyoseonensis]|uniref:Lipoprotein n=1 Tax=Limimaricola pyoseonensis TaxID=521013 RepID=A0A1G7E818_9RHOB|nr:hypothetical protein [Limimaricola pyoseonensis]SDE59854.1 hypothetical protein SAMN04488567_2044 [Limimaricola pyoseonensis]
MRVTPILAAAAATLLAGCEVAPPSAPVAVLPEPQPFAAEYRETPFSRGIVSVVSADPDGEMGAYRLLPCRQGTAVCLGHSAGTISTAGGTYVVGGLPHGRSFHLDHGGGGFMTLGGAQYPVAWEHFPEIELHALRR